MTITIYIPLFLLYSVLYLIPALITGTLVWFKVIAKYGKRDAYVQEDVFRVNLEYYGHGGVVCVLAGLAWWVVLRFFLFAQHRKRTERYAAA